MIKLSKNPTQYLKKFKFQENKLDIGQIVSALKDEKHRIDQALAALEGVPSDGAGNRSLNDNTVARGKKVGHLSIEGRRRLSELMRKRWAERRKKAAARAKK